MSDTCSYFTYFAVSDRCHGYSSCNALDDARCFGTCFSGDQVCTAEEECVRTTRYCTEVMEKIREVEMKMSPHALRPFSSTSWVAWMVGSVNMSTSLDSW